MIGHLVDSNPLLTLMSSCSVQVSLPVCSALNFYCPPIVLEFFSLPSKQFITDSTIFLKILKFLNFKLFKKKHVILINKNYFFKKTKD